MVPSGSYLKMVSFQSVQAAPVMSSFALGSFQAVQCVIQSLQLSISDCILHVHVREQALKRLLWQVNRIAGNEYFKDQLRYIKERWCALPEGR